MPVSRASFVSMLDDDELMHSIARIPVDCPELSDPHKVWLRKAIKIAIALLVPLVIVILVLFLIYFNGRVFGRTQSPLSFLSSSRRLAMMLYLLFVIVCAYYSFVLDPYDIYLLKEQVNFVRLTTALNQRLAPTSADYNEAELMFKQVKSDSGWKLVDHEQQHKLALLQQKETAKNKQLIAAVSRKLNQ